LAEALRNPRRRAALVITEEDAEEFFLECERLTNLRHLELRCGLERVPRKVFDLVRLRRIDLSHNRLNS
jgi:hypothetical protein